MSELSSSLGLALKVSPEMAASLRRNNNDITTEDSPLATSTNLDTLLQPLGRNQYHNEPTPQAVQQEQENDEFAQTVENDDGEEEDWNELLPAPRETTFRNNLSDDEEKSEEEEGEYNHKDDDDDDIPTSPPPHLPLVIVDLEKLCGYKPTTKEQAEELRTQVHAALYLDDDDDDDQAEPDKHASSLSMNFDERAGQLFDAHVAFHANTETSEPWMTQLNYAIVSYPEFLCRRNDDDNNTDDKVIVTSRQWKIMIQPHDIDIVNDVLQYLSKCNRCFFWKVDMCQQVKQLAQYEEYEKEKRHHEVELEIWRTSGRKVQLDKLYQVRETFQHRLDVAQDKLRTLQQEQTSDNDYFQHDETENDSVFDELMEGFDTSDAAGITLSSQDFSQGNQHQQQEPESNRDNEDGYRTSDTEKESSIDDDRDDASESSLDNHQDDVPPSTVSDSPQVQMAMAVVQSLEKRMKQVDDLLESLQEEEWADEEEEEEQTPGNIIEQVKRADKKGDELTLLDQILAMILGAISCPTDKSVEDHYKFIQQEHERIKHEWKGYFGRLPASLNSAATASEALSPKSNASFQGNDTQHGARTMVAPAASNAKADQTTSVADMKSALGIVDNDQEDEWDNVQDWDEILAKPVASTVNQEDKIGDQAQHGSKSNTEGTKKKNAVGLRPGGRA